MRILIVDPIFRVSRAYYSALLVNYFSALGDEVILLTREGYEGDYFDSIKNKFIDKAIDPSLKIRNAWYFRLNNNECKEIYSKVSSYIDAAKVDRVIFVGINEVFKGLFYWSDLISRQKRTRFMFVDYDSTYLYRPREKGGGFLKVARNFFKELLFDAVFATKSNVVLLNIDERVLSGAAKKKSYVRYAPEPCPPVSVAYIKKSRSERMRLAIVGKQTERKGLDIALQAMAQLCHIDGLKLVIIGRLAEETEVYRNVIDSMSNVEFNDGFFSQENLEKTIATCGCVLLPYKKSFNSSSGVLSLALSMGLPVVATDHGCIGYRVKNNEIGITFEAESAKSLAQKILSYLDLSEVSYEALSSNALTYARGSTEDAFCKEFAQ